MRRNCTSTEIPHLLRGEKLSRIRKKWPIQNTIECLVKRIEETEGQHFKLSLFETFNTEK